MIGTSFSRVGLMQTLQLISSIRFKEPMWNTLAKEMNMPWRAVEAMHWQLGEHEMAERANKQLFQYNSQSQARSNRARSGASEG